MTKEKKAFLLAPMVMPFAFVSGVSGFDMQFGLIDYVNSVLVIAIFGLPVVYIIELLIGLPIYLLFKKINLINILTLSFGGVVVANIPLLIIWAFGGYDGAMHKLTATIPLFIFIGFMVGLMFWLVLNFNHITNSLSGRKKHAA